MLEKPRKRALVLSGGGGRGAYHVGVLRFLEEHEWFPDIVVGTSIGAVNGAAIASGHRSQSLWALWRRLKSKNVQKLLLNPFEQKSFLDTSPLRGTLEKDGWVNFERVNSDEAAVHLRITAMEIETGRLRIFGNSPDVSASRMRMETLGVEHVIASCSIPIIYPATKVDGVAYWDGGTVANTPLGPAIDAGATEIVVVLMTPWDVGDVGVALPNNLLDAAGMAFEWALLASFQADLKMFRRINELVRLQVDNFRLRAENERLRAELREAYSFAPDLNNNGIPDYLEKNFQQLQEPIIIAPRRPIPVAQIIRYTLEGHEMVYEMGYEDAKRAWRESGRNVEGEA